ncbi:UDP-N-acetylmuramoyl-L-alanine--D-glutamate ligase [Anaplasmataceae bacterium AB001_6]|nr:UDP-N-acetylmuramoyl-L-alanine--D-glutamate ligase [Anaplasmataceae bacterium AB001_6]
MVLDKNSHYIFVYGLGITGLKLAEHISKKRKILIWDDSKKEKAILLAKNNANIELFNPLECEHFEFIDCAILSPGINTNKNEIALKLKKHNISIKSDIQFFSELYPEKNLIGITGTNGKTTLCTLIYYVLKEVGYNVSLCGNIGVSIFNKEAIASDWLIIEMSSFQLEITSYLKNLKFGVITNIADDHIDRHGSQENYIRAKFNIFNNPNTIAICGNHILECALTKGKDIKDAIVYEQCSKRYNASKEFAYQIVACDLEKLKRYRIDNVSKDNISVQSSILEKTSNIIKCSDNMNIENDNIHADIIKYAYLIIKNLSINKKDFQSLVEKFSGIEHRNEFFTSYKNINFINDSKATNLHAANYAIIKSQNKILWICGGRSKGKFSHFDFMISNNIMMIYAFGEVRHKISDELSKKNKSYEGNSKALGCNSTVRICENLEEAIDSAFRYAKNYMKEVDKNAAIDILFSPGFASFDMWKNFEERGKCFKKIVNDLLQKEKK